MLARNPLYPNIEFERADIKSNPKTDAQHYDELQSVDNKHPPPTISANMMKD